MYTANGTLRPALVVAAFGAVQTTNSLTHTQSDVLTGASPVDMVLF